MACSAAVRSVALESSKAPCSASQVTHEPAVCARTCPRGPPLSACQSSTTPLPRRAVAIRPSSEAASAHSAPPTLIER
eukprot:4795933-Prymnesium_polylepis.1